MTTTKASHTWVGEKDARVLRLRGVLDIHSVGALMPLLQSELARENPRQLDLREVSQADSAALALLVAIAQQPGETPLAILGMPAQLRALMDLYQLQDLFQLQ